MSRVGEQVIGMWCRTMYEDQGYAPSLDGSALMERLIDEAVAVARNEALERAREVAYEHFEYEVADGILALKHTETIL